MKGILPSYQNSQYKITKIILKNTTYSAKRYISGIHNQTWPNNFTNTLNLHGFNKTENSPRGFAIKQNHA